VLVNRRVVSQPVHRAAVRAEDASASLPGGDHAFGPPSLIVAALLCEVSLRSTSPRGHAALTVDLALPVGQLRLQVRLRAHRVSQRSPPQAPRWRVESPAASRPSVPRTSPCVLRLALRSLGEAGAAQRKSPTSIPTNRERWGFSFVSEGFPMAIGIPWAVFGCRGPSFRASRGSLSLY